MPLVRMPRLYPPRRPAHDPGERATFPAITEISGGSPYLFTFQEDGMNLRTGCATFAVALLGLSAAAPAAMASREPLNAYRLAPTAENKQRLAAEGYDMVEADHGAYLEIYGTAKQAAGLRK